MNERKIIFAWYKRFEKINKGTLRLHSILSLLLVFVLIWFVGIDIVQEYDAHTTEMKLFGIDRFFNFAPYIYKFAVIFFVYWMYWTLFRVYLWIYDGFTHKIEK
ncbi:MAG: hypothetical protein ABJR05_02035 [Balneola sp.]